jgi:hypothetical protein
MMGTVLLYGVLGRGRRSRRNRAEHCVHVHYEVISTRRPST